MNTLFSPYHTGGYVRRGERYIDILLYGKARGVFSEKAHGCNVATEPIFLRNCLNVKRERGNSNPLIISRHCVL